VFNSTSQKLGVKAIIEKQVKQNNIRRILKYQVKYLYSYRLKYFNHIDKSFKPIEKFETTIYIKFVSHPTDPITNLHYRRVQILQI
jgi:hypothetical protein